jgi:hypothetical protein
MNAANDQTQTDIPRFVFKDCALIAIATHKRAATLKEFRDHIETLSPDSLYYHFWGNLLLPHFEEAEYINDFASWVRHSLHDTKLAEQLAVLDPTFYNNPEDLRYRLLEYIDDRLEESEYLQWSQASQRFQFIRSQIVVFESRTSVATPQEMVEMIPLLSANSIFYHFIDSRRRTESNIDDFRQWLGFFGETYRPLIDQLSKIDPYFITLTQLRQQLATTFQNNITEAVS